jgi:hypothetical protein
LIDARILPPRWAAFTRDAQAVVPSKLGGGVALAATLLYHRLSRDLDLFLPSADAVAVLRRALPELAARAGATAELLQEAPGFVRARLVHPEGDLGIDLIHDAVPELVPAPVIVDGISWLSERDLRASKLTCLLSRSEPRDLVDVLFLERAGFLPEEGLADAARKDGAMDAGTLAWLLTDFPTSPLPEMLVPLTRQELQAYRDALGARMKREAVPRA